MATEKISPAWRKQYGKELKYDEDFRYAAGSPYIGDKREGKKPLKGGIGNPKNWPGGKWEMTHDPYENRKNLDDKKKVAGTKASGTAKKSSSKKTTRKRIAGK
jgi:hypothetical protein